MKLSKKQQAAVLAAALVLVAAGGTAAFLLTGKDSPKPESSLSAENSATEASQTAAEQKEPVPEGVYHEQEAQESSFYADSLYLYQGDVLWNAYSEEDYTSVAFVDSAGNQVLESPEIEMPEDAHAISALDFNGNRLDGYVENDTRVMHVFRYNEQGEVDRTVELKGLRPPTEEQPFFQMLKFLADDNYLYVIAISGITTKNLQVYDWEGNLILEYEDTQDAAIDGQGTFYSITGGTQQQTPYALLRYDLKTGEETVETPLWDFPEQVEYNRYDGRVYLATDKGVAVYYPGIRNQNDYSNGNNLRYILTAGEDTSFFSDDLRYLEDFAMAEDRSLYFNFIKMEGEGESFRSYQQIIPFTFEEGGKKEEKEPTFSITVPYANDFLKEAVIRFQKKYPEEHVEIDAAYLSEDAYWQSYDLYRDKISARLMAGDVGDIVSLSGEGLPVQNFLQSDALLDLTPYLEESGISTTLNPSILEAVEMNGATRGLPVTYQVPCLVADGALAEKLGVNLDGLDSWADVFHLLPRLKESSSETPLFNSSKNLVAWAMIDSCMPRLIDVEQKTVSLNRDWFRETLESFKAVEDDPMLAKMQDFSIMDPLMGSMFSPYDIGEGYVSDDFSRQVDSYPDGYCYLPMPGGQQFECKDVFGIAASSDNPDAAWKFLEYLYSEEIQSLHRRGIPVTQEGWEKDFLERMSYHNAPSNMEDFEAIVKGADTLKLQSEFTNLFAAHFQKYLDDEETLDQMLAAAEEEIWLYLNE